MVSFIKTYPKSSIGAVFLAVGAGIAYLFRNKPYVSDWTDQAGA